MYVFACTAPVKLRKATYLKNLCAVMKVESSLSKQSEVFSLVMQMNNIGKELKEVAGLSRDCEPPPQSKAYSRDIFTNNASQGHPPPCSRPSFPATLLRAPGATWDHPPCKPHSTKHKQCKRKKQKTNATSRVTQNCVTNHEYS